MWSLIDSELAAIGLSPEPAQRGPVTEADLEEIPPAARRYFRFCGAIDRERVWSFRASFGGRIRRGDTWRSVKSVQHNTADPEVARLFYMRMSMFGVRVQGRDTYIRGEGRLLIRPLDLFTVQDWNGPEADMSELSTWLNDSVLFAPSMLLHPRTTWRALDNNSFEVGIIDEGHAVSAAVFLGADGEVRDFRTDDRWMAGKQAVRATWSTPIERWRAEDGRMLPAAGKASWLLPDGDFTYADFTMGDGSVVFNVPLPT